MITESKVTEIFCIADDFCKEFEGEMAKNALPSTTKRSLEEGVGMLNRTSQTLRTSLTDIDRQFYNRLNTTLAELDTCIQAMIKGR